MKKIVKRFGLAILLFAAMMILWVGGMCFLNIGNANATAGPNDPYYVPHPDGGAILVKTAYVSATTNGDNAIVAAVTGKKIVVWMFEISPEVLTSMYWKSGSTAITQTLKLGAYGGWVREAVNIRGVTSPVLVTAAGSALNLNCNTTGPVTVFIKYTEE